MGIKALGYVVIETAQPDRWDHFLTQVAGVMRAPDAADGAAQYRIDQRSFRFRIEQSDREWFKAAGYEVADAAALEALADRVRAAGHAIEPLSADEAALRGVTAGFRTTDPAGNYTISVTPAGNPGVTALSFPLQPAKGAELTAIVTNQSVQNLGLAEGRDVLAFVKASSIVLMVEEEGARVSARNRFRGLVQKIHHGPVNTEVTLDLPGGHHVLTAVVTDQSVERLGLAVGQPVTAIFKASSVFLVSTD